MMTRKQRMSGVHYIKSHCVNVVLLFGKRFLIPKGKFCPNIGATMSILAISLSIAILIIVTSVMNGFRDELIEKILGFNSHITITKRYGEFQEYNEINNKILSLNDVKFSNPIINGAGMLMNDYGSSGVFVKGISNIGLQGRKDLSRYIIGELKDFHGFSVIMGHDIATELGVKINDDVNLIVPIATNTIFGMIPRYVKLKVVGILKTNAQQYDNYMVLMPFSTAQRIFNLNNKASSIEIITANPQNIYTIENEIMQTIPNVNTFILSDWQLENGALLNALKVEANVMDLILGLFIIISMFTIFAVIRMTVKAKEREIAILKSHGIPNRQINHIFIMVGMVIALIGMTVGNVLGISVALNIESIRLFLENIFNTKLLDGSVYLLSNLPSKLMTNDVLKINIFALFMAFFCTILSTHINTKIDITKTLRNN